MTTANVKVVCHIENIKRFVLNIQDDPVGVDGSDADVSIYTLLYEVFRRTGFVV